MVHAIVVLCGLVSGLPDASPSKEVMQAYRQACEAVPRTAEAHVKLALWCEANGMVAERAEHLAKAIAIDSDDAQARGLLGQIRHDGRWRSPESVADRVQADSDRTAKIQTYHEQRAATSPTGQGQWELALWCEAHGLADEAAAHFATVTKLGPGKPVDHRAEAWKRLGYSLHQGQWKTDAQVEDEKSEAKAQHLANREWMARLAHLRDHAKSRDEADRELASVTHPRAVPAVWSTFAKGSAADQAKAVQLLGQIDAPAASRALAVLAIQGKSPEVCRAAAETLARRDPREVVSWLISLITTRMKYEVMPVDQPDAVGMLRVEGEKAIAERVYFAKAHFVPDENFNGVIGRDGKGVPFAVSGRTLFTRGAAGNFDAPVVQAEIQRNRDRLAEAQTRLRGTAEQYLLDDIQRIESYNGEAQFANTRRVLPVLNAVTGKDFGDNKDAWTKWWLDRQGYRYISPTKPVYRQTQIASEGVSVTASTSCFGAGTPVITITGPRPIESLSVGDQVLSRDAKTGVLSYRAIEAVHHNPPDATLKITMGDDVVITTGFHRFWKSGQGWVMARDLKTGDLLRTRDGSVRVSKIENDAVQPVFNLDVAKTRSFFVGKNAEFVHDNSPPSPEMEPFDAIAVLPGQTK